MCWPGSLAAQSNQCTAPDTDSNNGNKDQKLKYAPSLGILLLLLHYYKRELVANFKEAISNLILRHIIITTKSIILLIRPGTGGSGT